MFRKGRLIGFLLSALFLWLAVRNVSPSELAAAFAQANYPLVAPAAAATLCGYVLRTVRWQRIVLPVAPLRFTEAFGVLMMGFAANNLLPARLGEFVRAYMLRRKTGARKTYGMATILLERVCDGLTLIVVLGIVSLLKPLPLWGQEVQVFSSLLFLGAALGIVGLLAREKLALRLIGLVLRLFPPGPASSILRAADAFIAGLRSLKSRRGVALVVFLSVMVWLLEASSYLLMIGAFDIGLDLPVRVLASFFLLAVVNLGIMVPSAPGYVGTFQILAVLALGAFGVPKELALAVAIASHLMQWLMVTTIGLLFFLRENLGLRNLEVKASEEPDDEEMPAVTLP